MLHTELFFAFIFGALGYGGLELLWRGHTHWTMLAAGGVCLCAMYLISTRTRWSRVKMCAASASVITTVEFVTGAIVNARLGWNVWDYSGMPLNLCGQICLPYCLLWLGLSLPCTALCRLTRRKFFGGQ